MNPFASHWLRMAFWLFAISPLVALMVMFTSDDTGFTTAIVFTLYMWALVCVILALIALAGLILRLIGRGVRALRR